MKIFLLTNKVRPWLAAMISLGQYIIAVVAVPNIIMTSIDLGRKSILDFACTTKFAPLLWKTCSFEVHLISVVGYFIERKMAHRRISVEQVLKEGESSKTAGDSEQLASKSNRATTSPLPQQRFPRS